VVIYLFFHEVLESAARITTSRTLTVSFVVGAYPDARASKLHLPFYLGRAMHELSKSLLVYVVENSPIIRRLLASTIEAAGGKLIGHSATAQSAIADLSSLRPDLILIDVSLKSGSGFDVLEALQALDPKPSAIKVVLTNHASEEFRALSFRMGANGFFEKGTETAQVLALITALASEKQRRWNLPNVPSHPRPESDSRK
jgi:CheY-like chemotaxis protein